MAAATAQGLIASYLIYVGLLEQPKVAAVRSDEDRAAELLSLDQTVADVPVTVDPAEVLVAGRADEAVAGQADVGSTAAGVVVDGAGDSGFVARTIAAEQELDESAASFWTRLLKEAPRSPKVLFGPGAHWAARLRIAMLMKEVRL